MHAFRILLLLTFCIPSGCQFSDQMLPVKIELGESSMDVPAGCFDAPLVIGGRDKRVRQKIALFAMLLPDLRCRDRSNDLDFEQTGDDRPSIEILASVIGPKANPNATDLMFSLITEKRAVPGTRHIVDQNDAGDVHWVFEDSNYHQLHDAWRSASDPRTYLVCSRSQTQVRGEPFVGDCDHHFVYRGLDVKLDYGAAWAGRRHEIQQKTIGRLDQFTVGAATVKFDHARRQPSPDR